jgi:hypothetical protein
MPNATRSVYHGDFAMPKRITIQLVGSASDKEDVRINDLLDQLSAIRRALRETDMMLSGKAEPTLDYKVVDLRHSSPATISLEPIPIAEVPPKYAESVSAEFSAELRLIKREGKLLAEPELQRLTAYEHIGTAKNNLIQKVRITVDRKVVTIDEAFKRNIEKIMGPDELSDGSVAGMLEAVNFHNTNRFTLYPTLGPRKVNGTFENMELRGRVKQAIGSFVTVFGRLKFKAWSQFPHGIIAEDIDIHEPDSELPTLTELRGAFSGMTGGASSVAFLDRIRDEDWQQ